MRRLRPRSVYDVLALISFFLVIGGGTALASYVVSSNSQVGPGTISGHQPPTGKHANIISGSVNGTDLAHGAVTNAKLSPKSVNSSKVVDGSLSATDTNTNTIQRRVSGACPSGQATRSITQAGGVTCGVTNGGTPGGSAGGDLTGSYPNPSIGGDTIGANRLAPFGDDVNFNTAPVEAVPFVIRSHFNTFGMSPGSSVDDVIYNANAPQGFTVLDAWTDGSGGFDVYWELRDATGGGGSALTDPQAVPHTLTRLTGELHTSTVVPKGGTLVARATNLGSGTEGATFDLYVLALPVP